MKLYCEFSYFPWVIYFLVFLCLRVLIRSFSSFCISPFDASLSSSCVPCIWSVMSIVYDKFCLRVYSSVFQSCLSLPLLSVFSQLASCCVSHISCFILIVACPVFSAFSFASSPSQYVRSVPAVFPLPSLPLCVFKPVVFLCLLLFCPT